MSKNSGIPNREGSAMVIFAVRPFRAIHGRMTDE